MRVGFLLLVAYLSACAAVPTQLKDAMVIQKAEIKNVKEVYAINVTNLLDSIEKYRLAILDIHEANRIAKFSKTLDEVNGTITEVSPTGDANVDHIRLSTLQKINTFFDDQREKVREDIRLRRVQYASINQNFENIEAVNEAVNNYIESLVRLKNGRDAAAKGLLKRVTGLTSLPISFKDLPDPSTIEDLASRFTTQGETQ